MSLLFQPPQTKNELNQYLDTYLGGTGELRLSDNLVDPESTTSPLEACWSIYQAMLTNKGPKSYVACCSRNCGKTLLGSIVAMLGMIIFRRQVVVMSATKAQSEQMIAYLESHLRSSPELLQCFKSDSKMEKKLIELPPNSYTKSNRNTHCVVVAATRQGANSRRAQLLLLDEVDLVHPSIIAEVAGVIDPTRDEHRFQPITLYLSSRKAPDGPLQTAIDKTEKRPDKWKLLKWSVTDLLLPCPHKEELIKEMPKPALISNDTLEIKWDTTIEDIEESERDKWYQRTYYDKCKGCQGGYAWTFCQGLTVKSKESDSPARRDLEFVDQVFDVVSDVPVLIAQYLNWKPETRGSVFRMLDVSKHTGTVEDVYKWALNLPQDVPTPKNLTWDQLARTLKKSGWYLSVGIDYGYHPDPSVMVLAAINPTNGKTAIIHTLYRNFFGAKDFSEMVYKYLKEYSVTPSIVCPDYGTDPAARGYFHELNTTEQKPPRIEPGVSQIRGLLLNPIRDEHFFMIVQDTIFFPKYLSEMMGWRHARNIATGEWIQDKYEDKNNHGPDATRYALDPFKDIKPQPSIVYADNNSQTNFSSKLSEMEDKGKVDQKDVVDMIHNALENKYGINSFNEISEEDEDDGSGSVIIC